MVKSLSSSNPLVPYQEEHNNITQNFLNDSQDTTHHLQIINGTTHRSQEMRSCCNRRGIFLHQHGVSHNTHKKKVSPKNSSIFDPHNCQYNVNVKCYLRRASGKQVANNVRLLNQSFTHISRSVNKRRRSLAARKRMNPFSRPSPRQGRQRRN